MKRGFTISSGRLRLSIIREHNLWKRILMNVVRETVLSILTGREALILPGKEGSLQKQSIRV